MTWEFQYHRKDIKGVRKIAIHKTGEVKKNCKGTQKFSRYCFHQSLFHKSQYNNWHFCSYSFFTHQVNLPLQGILFWARTAREFKELCDESRILKTLTQTVQNCQLPFISIFLIYILVSSQFVHYLWYFSTLVNYHWYFKSDLKAISLSDYFMVIKPVQTVWSLSVTQQSSKVTIALKNYQRMTK